jgi:hypothetical protein
VSFWGLRLNPAAAFVSGRVKSFELAALTVTLTAAASAFTLTVGARVSVLRSEFVKAIALTGTRYPNLGQVFGYLAQWGTLHILCMGDWLQMSGIAASFDPAQMVKFMALGNGAD